MIEEQRGGISFLDWGEEPKETREDGLEGPWGGGFVEGSEYADEREGKRGGQGEQGTSETRKKKEEKSRLAGKWVLKA